MLVYHGKFAGSIRRQVCVYQDTWRGKATSVHVLSVTCKGTVLKLLLFWTISAPSVPLVLENFLSKDLYVSRDAEKLFYNYTLPKKTSLFGCEKASFLRRNLSWKTVLYLLLCS